MSRARTGWLLIAVAVFVPLVSLPFAKGYQHGAGVIGNIGGMWIHVMPDTAGPSFEEFTKAEMAQIDATAPFVDIPKNGQLLPDAALKLQKGDYADKFFGPDEGKIRLYVFNGLDEQVRSAIRVGRKEIENSTSKYLGFYHWGTVKEGARLPFSWIASGSALVGFIGVVLLIFNRTSKN